MNDFLNWMENSAVSQLILGTSWMFPALETLHFIGLILLIGSVSIVDLRFLGFAPRIPLSAVTRFVPISLLGFAINLSTGTLFVFTDPFRYYPNPAFRLKMLAVLLAGLNALWFKYAVDWQRVSSQPNCAPALSVRWIAGFSLVLWLSIIVLGRFIPYVE